jgi:hypothetical protein
MPIQSHTLEQTTQENGATHNVLRMVDQDGKELIASFRAQPAEVDAIVAAQIALANANLSEQEFNDIVSAE